MGRKTKDGVELKLARCTVREWRPGDAPSLAKHANNIKVWRNLHDAFPHPYTRADAVEWIKQTSKEHADTVFAIEVDGSAVGGVHFPYRSATPRPRRGAHLLHRRRGDQGLPAYELAGGQLPLRDRGAHAAPSPARGKARLERALGAGGSCVRRNGDPLRAREQ